MKTRNINVNLSTKVKSGIKYQYTLPVNNEEEAKAFLLARAASYAVRTAEQKRYFANPAAFIFLSVEEMLDAAAKLVLAERVKRKLTAEEKAARKANKELQAHIDTAVKLKEKGKTEEYVQNFLEVMDTEASLIELILEEVFGTEEEEA